MAQSSRMQEHKDKIYSKGIDRSLFVGSFDLYIYYKW
jgi:hypothetical protein